MFQKDDINSVIRIISMIRIVLEHHKNFEEKLKQKLTQRANYFKCMFRISKTYKIFRSSIYLITFSGIVKNYNKKEEKRT